VAGRPLARALLAALLVVATAGPAVGGLADRVGATFSLMLEDVVAAFPAVEGVVASVEGDRVFLDLGEKAEMKAGQELTVYRKGEPFRHPISGKVLGRYEEILGYAQVQQVFPNYSHAIFVPVPQAPAVRPADGARISRGRLRVAVAPMLDLTSVTADLRRVPFMIALGLDQTKRFQSVDPATVQEEMLKQGARVEELFVRPKKAITLGRVLEVSGWVVPVLLERRGVTYLDVTWISAVTGSALFSQRVALTRGDTVADQRFPWEPRRED
jgi:hypothetical protein